MAILYALLAAIAYAAIALTALGYLAELLGVNGKSCGSAIATGIITSAILVYISVDKYFSEK